MNTVPVGHFGHRNITTTQPKNNHYVTSSRTYDIPLSHYVYNSLVPRPNLSGAVLTLKKNRQTRKLGQVDVQWSVMVGVHYIISYQ